MCLFKTIYFSRRKLFLKIPIKLITQNYRIFDTRISFETVRMIVNNPHKAKQCNWFVAA